MHRGGWALIAVSTAAVALSACSSPTLGVLTQADIPSYLAMKYNPSASASDARSVRSAPCKAAAEDVFNGSKNHSPIVFSVALACASVAQAQNYFNTIKVGAKRYPISGVVGYSVPGIGDAAWLVDEGTKTDLRDYIVGWRQDDRVSFVMVEGPSTDKRITPALVELLARRAAARS